MLDCGLLRSKAVTNDLQFLELAMMPHLAALGLAHGAGIARYLTYLPTSEPGLASGVPLIRGPAHLALHQQLCWRAITKALIGSSGWAIIAVGPLGQAAGMSYKRPPAIGSLLWDL